MAAAVVGTVLLIAPICCPTAAHATVAGGATLAAGDVADTAKRRRRIAVLPIRSALVRTSELFGGAPDPRDSTAELRAAVLTSLQSRDYVDILSPTAVREQLRKARGAAGTASVARERYRLGVEYYLSMAFDRAVDSLKRAETLYDEIFHDIVAPRAPADAWLIRAVALVQAGQHAEAHVAFKRMFALQPSRRFARRGFYGPAVDAALVTAFEDFLATGRHDSPFGDVERLHRLAERLHADALVIAAQRRGPEGEQAVISVFRAADRVVAGRLVVPLRGFSEPGSRAARRIDAFVSRQVACVPVRARTASAKSPKRRHIWLDTGATAGAFLRKPTRQQFYSLGFSAGIEQRMRTGVSWFGRANVLTSLSDPWRDLPQAFNSLRGIVGLGFARTIGPVRLFFKPGVEAHVLGSARTTSDANCKFFGVDSYKCDKTVTRNLEQDVLLGVNGAVGAQVHLGRRFFLASQASSAWYFFPLSGAQDLNFPLFIDLGLGHEF